MGSWEAKFIMDGISKKLIKDGIHSTSSSATPLTSSAADDGNAVAKNLLMRGKFTQMVKILPKKLKNYPG